MPKRSSPQASPVYQLKVQVLGIKPLIWRRLEVPSDIRMDKLHRVLQASFGWEECHLHEFRIGGRSVGMPSPDDLDDGEAEDERKVRTAAAHAATCASSG
jgi:hypothetical protein